MNRKIFLRTVLCASLTVPFFANSQGTIGEQCKGTTKTNQQCKNIVDNESGLCYLHDPNYIKKEETQSVVCSDTTQAGNPCKVRTKDESGVCHHHRDWYLNWNELALVGLVVRGEI